MKKLLLIIALCPLTNIRAMIARVTPLARVAFATSRSFSSTSTLTDHQHTPSFPFRTLDPLQLKEKIMDIEQKKVREALRIEAHKEAIKGKLNLEECFNALMMVLEQQKKKMPFKQYCDMSGKIQESLIRGKVDITINLVARLNQIDKEPISVDKN
jgi:hypothetical protein